jgi:spermidine synthase
MVYRRLPDSRPPPCFELWVRTSLRRLDALRPLNLPPQVMVRLRRHIETMLLAECLPPTPAHLAMLIDDFARLLTLSRDGAPILYKKRNTLTLLFDMFSVQSEMRLEAPDELVLGYTQSMMAFLMFQPNPREIGMIGLGGGSLAKFCYRHLPAAAITVAEIDPQVIALRDCFHIPANDARFHVHCMDGAQLVGREPQRFDVLVVDGFDGGGQPAQLCSQRFYDDCFAALTPGGVMAVNLLYDQPNTGQYLARIRRSFHGAVTVIDSFDSYNKVVFAYKGDLRAIDPQTFMERFARLEPHYPAMLKMAADAILRQGRGKSSP